MELKMFTPPSLAEWRSWTPEKSPRHTIVEPKYDGVRAVVHCHPEEGVVIHTRRTNKDGVHSRLEAKVPHLMQMPFLLELAQNGYTVLDGELTANVKRDCLSATMSVVGAHYTTAIKVQQNKGPLRLTIFDVSRWHGESVAEMPLRERKQLLESVPHTPILWPIASSQEPDPAIRQAMLDSYLSEGYEGAVFKNPDSGYFDWGAWIKRKERTTVDALVTGWHWGGGKYSGTIGSLLCSVVDGASGKLRCICSVSPGTDAQRHDLFQRISELDRAAIANLGIVVELEAQGWSVGGGLRHPRVLRYRTDRDAPNKVLFDGSRSRVE